MKKILLLSLSLTFTINAFSQVNVKNNPNYLTTIYSKINDVDSEQNMLGDEILWSTTFADTSNVSTEDLQDLVTGNGVQQHQEVNGVKTQELLNLKHLTMDLC